MSLNQLAVGEVQYQVEPRVMQVLHLLVRHQGRLVHRQTFLDTIWSNEDVSDEVLTRAISLLRKIFAKTDPGRTYIKTIPRRGYTLSADIECDAANSNTLATDHNAVRPSHSEAKVLMLQAKTLLEQPFTRGVVSTAISYLEQAVLLEEDNPTAHESLGSAYAQAATYSQDKDKYALLSKAATSAERAIQLDPGLGLPLTLIAMKQFVEGEVTAAIKTSLAAMQLAPDDAEVSLRLGYYLALIGQTRRAIPHLERSVELDPTRGRNLQSLAQAKLCNGDLDEAEFLAKRAIDLQHLFAHDTYAAIAYARKKYDLAGERFTEGCYAMFRMFGDRFSDPEKWLLYSRLVFSPDPDARAVVIRWVRDLCEVEGEPPSIPLMIGLVRTGAAKAIFEVCNGKMPIGSHGALLRIWGDVDTCRMIYGDDEFTGFAKDIGLSKAWQLYGGADRLVH